MEALDKDQRRSNLGCFTILVLLVQGLGLTAVILVAVWMGHFREGFAWQNKPGLEFNYHPVFMVIGMVFLYADAILAYRVFRNVKKIYIKVVHAVIQVAALMFAAVGLKAVFDSHNLASEPTPNLYSLHSWLGLTTVILFGLQWIGGFVAFLFPGLTMGSRRMMMPYHVFFGLTIFIMAVGTALTGITEKAIFLSAAIKYSSKPPEGLLLNCLGLCLVALASVVVYIMTRSDYKRQPSPDEEHIQLVGD